MGHMPWIRCSTDLPEHPKSEALALALDEPRAWTHVLQLWLWAAKVRPDGNLSGIPPETVAEKAGWKRRDSARFLAAIRDVGFLDGDELHDWRDFQRNYVERLEKDRARKAAARAAAPDLSAGQAADKRADNHGQSADSPRARDPAGARAVTVRDVTGRDETKKDPSPAVAGGARLPPRSEDEIPAGELPLGVVPKVAKPKPAKAPRPRWRDPCPGWPDGRTPTQQIAHSALPAGEDHPDREVCDRCGAWHDLAMDAVGRAYRDAFGLGVGEHEWNAAEATQYAASRKRWDVATICAALVTFSKGSPFERGQKLAAMLTPSQLEVAMRGKSTPDKPTRKPENFTGPMECP